MMINNVPTVRVNSIVSQNGHRGNKEGFVRRLVNNNNNDGGGLGSLARFEDEGDSRYAGQQKQNRIDDGSSSFGWRQGENERNEDSEDFRIGSSSQKRSGRAGNDIGVVSRQQNSYDVENNRWQQSSQGSNSMNDGRRGLYHMEIKLVLKNLVSKIYLRILARTLN